MSTEGSANDTFSCFSSHRENQFSISVVTAIAGERDNFEY